MQTNFIPSSIAVTIYSSPDTDPDGDGVPNQDDVKPFDATVFANLTIPAEYALWKWCGNGDSHYCFANSVV